MCVIVSASLCDLQYPAYAVYILTVLFGVGNHYLLPHVKKEMPWLCCSEPICKPKEWDVFEVTGTWCVICFVVLHL